MRAFEIQRQVHLASQTLPAAGAYTAQAYIDLPPGTKLINFWITYTRGDAGGQPVFKLQWGNGTEVDANELLQQDAGLAITNDEAEIPLFNERPLLPPPPDANPQVYTLPVQVLDMGARKLRLLVAEKGAPGTPGTVAIAYTGTRGGPL